MSAPVRRVFALVEGQTEEAFVKRVLGPHLMGAAAIAVTPVIVMTKRVAAGGKHKGGVSSWGQVKGDLLRLLGDSGAAAVTTMIDLYGLPTAWPGLSSAPTDPIGRVAHVEATMSQDVGDPRFMPHITLHEFETMVFACPTEAALVAGDAALETKLRADVIAAGGAELVNEGHTTAPSKRLLNGHWRSYAKTTDGPTVVERGGLAALRQQCAHLDAWVMLLESL